MSKVYKCPKCGSKVDDSMPTCPKCGKKFAWSKVATKETEEVKKGRKSRGLKQCSPWLFKNRFNVKNLSYFFPVVPIVCSIVFKNYRHSKNKEYQKAYKDTLRWAITSTVCWLVLFIVLFVKIIQGLQELDMHSYY